MREYKKLCRSDQKIMEAKMERERMEGKKEGIGWWLRRRGQDGGQDGGKRMEVKKEKRWREFKKVGKGCIEVTKDHSPLWLRGRRCSRMKV
jgi:hypothetical protein